MYYREPRKRVRKWRHRGVHRRARAI